MPRLHKVVSERLSRPTRVYLTANRDEAVDYANKEAAQLDVQRVTIGTPDDSEQRVVIDVRERR